MLTKIEEEARVVPGGTRESPESGGTPVNVSGAKENPWELANKTIINCAFDSPMSPISAKFGLLPPFSHWPEVSRDVAPGRDGAGGDCMRAKNRDPFLFRDDCVDEKIWD